MYQYIALAVLGLLGSAEAQINAQASVAQELRECYSNPLLVDRNNLPPPSVSTLIDIIQKIEDNSNVNVDLRMLAVLLLHTYRQDGMEFHAQEAASNIVLPFSPTFHAFHRHRLLLSKLIPNNNLQPLANTTLPSTLKCALHHMLSTTIDARVRGDENTCGQLSEYRALRTPRAAGVDDVEIFVPVPTLENTEYGQMRRFDPNDEVEYRSNYGAMQSARQQLQGDSTCPILDGVIHTLWGATSAGNVIAGIAAGAERQTVPISELTKEGTVQSNTNGLQNVDNLYPATVAGDLAEAALIQGSRARTDISIGSSGNFNSSQARRFFMLSSRQNVEMTDPEIRGDLDGFVLGSRMTSILQTYNTLKLSQLLDMYYSPRNGVFDSSVRACNRRDLSTAVLSDTNLASQTESFAAALNAHMALTGTINTGLTQFVTTAIRNFQTYTQSNMNDLSCSVTEATSDIRLRTNLYIVLDATWPYATIYPAISYLLDAIDVGKFGSSVTLLSAFDGSVVVNKTFSPAEFHSEYTLIKHQTMMTGVNLETAFTNIRNTMQYALLNETAMNYVGGNSSVLLFLLNAGTIQNTQTTFEQARSLNESVPDLRILFATSTNQLDNLWNLVRDMHDDIHVISLTNTGVSVGQRLATVLDRIQRANRRIINPLCGYEFTTGSSGTRQFDDFIEPGYIQFYSVSPNYFYGNNDNTRVRVSRTSASSGTLTVCYSRTITQPRRNGTIVGIDDNLMTCQDLASSGNVEISLQNACGGYSTIGSCPPMYISVQAAASTTFTAICTDSHLCRFPYNIRYTVQVEEFQCFSSGASFGASVLLIIVAVLFNF